MKKVTHLFLLFALTFHLQSVAQYSWNNVGGGMNSIVSSLAADTTNNLLYAGGLFTQADGIPSVNIAKWDGTSWSPVGSGVISGVGISSLLVQDNGDLIAGGSFGNIGSILSNNVARWDGTDWFAIGDGLDSGVGFASVNALVIYNNELYAGGIFSNSGLTPANSIARWDGANWQPLGTGINGTVKSLCVYNGELYAGGTFTDAGGVPVKNIARWNGATWSDVGEGVQYTGGTTVSTMLNFGSALYAGGTFDTAGTTHVNNIAMWDGATWSDVGGGTEYTGGTTVSTMLNFNNVMVVGGIFDSLGNTGSNFIGTWNGTSWGSLGNGTNNSVLGLGSLGDTLYAGGVFTHADTSITLFIAQWVPDTASVATSLPEKESSIFSVFPNPVKDHLKIKCADNENSIKDNQSSFILYDILGIKILEIKNIGEDLYFNRSGIKDGLYLYKIADKNNVLIRQGKLSFN
jgi:trimeric autotransporter adhesin